MGRVKLTVGRKSPGPVVLHLDRAVAHDLLLALTQALEPHSANIGKLTKNLLKGRPLKATSPGGKSPKGKSPRGEPKGKRSKRSR